MAVAGHLGVRIDHRGNDFRYAGGNQRIDTGRRPALVRARLQRDIDGGTLRLVARMLERRDLGMRLAGLAMPALTDNLTVFYNNAADAWIRMR